jgi:fused signal recognition particle receptor
MGLFGSKSDSEKTGWLGKLKQGLTATRNVLSKRVNDLFFGGGKLDEEMLGQLEEILITSDVGVNTTMRIVDDLRKLLKSGSIKTPQELQDALKKELTKIIGNETPTLAIKNGDSLSILMVVGVNGTGKTTAIGKIANWLQQDGKKVIIAAGDTFRAAAIDQLEVWAERSKCQIIKHNPGADPAAVVFDALAAAKARESNILIIDTAGRLHTKSNLMEELKKIGRVLQREAIGIPQETLLVLDATTGQNAVQQAKLFAEAVPVTGIILTKLDGTAKGGIVITIADEMKIPVKLIGVGEGIDDLREFNPQEFVEALFEN